MAADYISRDAALKDFESCNAENPNWTPQRVKTLLLRQPAADAVPVVRCRDCEYYKNHPNGLCYLHTEPKANRQGYSGEAVCVEPDDFCSYGLRKGGNDNVSG